MPVEAGRLVLGQHQDFPQTAIETVRQREIDDAVDPAKRHGRLRAINGERFQPRAFSAGENQSKNGTHKAEVIQAALGNVASQ